MGNSISIFFLIEAVGTIAFASSGAMVAIRQNLDLLGIIVLGVTTAVGGGMMRDILLVIVPPSLFTNPIYTIMAFITVMVLFIVIRMNQHFLEGDCIVTYEKLMNIFDAIGLAAFTVTGIDTAVMAGYGDYHFLSVFLGVLTGVGGGLLRDIMARQTPYILKKHVYACASIAGGICYSFLLSSPVNNDIAMITSAADPSLRPEALPAVVTPPSKIGFNLAIFSSFVLRLGNSSVSKTTGAFLRCGIVTGTISSLNRPASIALIARRWLCRAKASHSSRVI